MKANTRTAATEQIDTDERDIDLVVAKTIERGSMSDEQALALGISPESLARNRNKIAARIRASSMEFAA